MTYSENIKHAAILLIIFAAAFLVNGAGYFLTGIPLKYHLSSDTLVHQVHWQEASKYYNGNFVNDAMFQNSNGWPTGQLFINKVLVRVAEAFRIDLLDWTIFISVFSLILFLSGVYFLVFYTLKNKLLGLVISLASIIPVISLGLSGWGFLVLGFVPKTLAVGITVWLSVLYFSGIIQNSKARIFDFFLLLGIFSNWYPIVFFHYAMVMLTVEVVMARKIKKEHILYGLIFLAASPVALFDLFVKSTGFSTPDIAVIYNHYTWVLHSWKYLIFHYLRKQIIYSAIIGGLWYIYRRILKMEYPKALHYWYAIWWSTLLWSLVGVGTELFAPLYMKYLLARISVWFYLASMVIVAYTSYEIYFAKFKRTVLHAAAYSLILLSVLLSQTSLLSTYDGIKDFRNEASDYKQQIAAILEIKEKVPTGTILLVNPDGEASNIRAYGGFGIYVSQKDGNVALTDGKAGAKWLKRYKETAEVFAQKDFNSIQNFAIEKKLQYYFFDKKDVERGTSILKSLIVYEQGDYGIAKMY